MQSGLHRREVFRVRAVRIAPQPAQHHGNDVDRRVQHRDAAGRQPLRILRLQQQVPGISRRIRGESLDTRCVVADSGGPPQIDRTEPVTRIGTGDPLHLHRIEIRQVRNLGPVQRFQRAGTDKPGEGRFTGRHHDVVTRVAGEQLGLQRLQAVIHVVAHMDAGLMLETFQHRRVDIVGPVVEIDRPPLRTGRQDRDNEQQQGQGQTQEH